jgi:hypothetical protein
MSQAVYPPYGTSQITLTIDVVRGLVVALRRVMVQLFQAVQTGNTVQVNAILSTYQNNSFVYNILSTLVQGMQGPQEFTPTVLQALGVYPPQAVQLAGSRVIQYVSLHSR